jgi:hypothetical protein
MAIRQDSRYDIFGQPIAEPIFNQAAKNTNIPEEEILLRDSRVQQSPQQAPQPKPEDVAGRVTGNALGAAGANSLFGSSVPVSAAATPTAAATTSGGMALPSLPTVGATGAQGASIAGGTTAAGYGGASAAAPATGLSIGGALSNLGAMGVGPAMGIAGGAMLLNQGAQDLKEGESPAYSDFKENPQGVASRAQLAWTTGGLSEVARGLGFGHKNPRVEQRGQIRKYFDEQLSANRSFTGVRGQTLNIGAHELDLGQDAEGKWNNPIAAESVAMVDPFAQTMALGIAQQQGKAEDAQFVTEMREDIGALISRSVADGSQNSDEIRTNILSLMKDELGMTADQVVDSLAQSYQAEHIDWDTLRTMAGSFGRIMGKDVDQMTAEIREKGGF